VILIVRIPWLYAFLFLKYQLCFKFSIFSWPGFAGFNLGLGTRSEAIIEIVIMLKTTASAMRVGIL
jgi:hypothetical protein